MNPVANPTVARAASTSDALPGLYVTASIRTSLTGENLMVTIAFEMAADIRDMLPPDLSEEALGNVIAAFPQDGSEITEHYALCPAVTEALGEFPAPLLNDIWDAVEDRLESAARGERPGFTAHAGHPRVRVASCNRHSMSSL